MPRSPGPTARKFPFLRETRLAGVDEAPGGRADPRRPPLLRRARPALRRRLRPAGTILPRTPADIRAAWNLFREKKAAFLMGVTDYPYDPYHMLVEKDGVLDPVFPHFKNRQAQELPKPWVSNGAIYLADSRRLAAERTLYGPGLIGYFMPRERSVDIDTPFDFALAEFLLSRRAPAPD